MVIQTLDLKSKTSFCTCQESTNVKQTLYQYEVGSFRHTRIPQGTINKADK